MKQLLGTFFWAFAMLAMAGVLPAAQAADLNDRPPLFSRQADDASPARFARPIWCHASLGMSRNVLAARNETTGDSIGFSGFAVPIGAGCDYRFAASNWSVGLLAHYTIGNLKEQGVKVSGTYGVAARVGYLLQPGLMLYAKLGMDFSHLKDVTTGEKDNLRGVPLGIGAEIKITDSGWLRFDYTRTMWRDLSVAAGAEVVKSNSDTFGIGYVHRF